MKNKSNLEEQGVDTDPFPPKAQSIMENKIRSCIDAFKVEKLFQ